MTTNNPELWCDNDNHKAEVDIVTYILHPDEVIRQLVVGSAKDIAATIKDMEDRKAPSASLFVSYCCDKCKEVVNG